MAICPRCQVFSDGHRCQRCGMSLAHAPPTVPTPAPPPAHNGELGPLGRFVVTLICAYIFTSLCALLATEFRWFVSPWFHLANLGLAIAGIFWFHPLTNWMRNFHHDGD